MNGAMSVPGPLLLPQNRKLRHLKGIYLRNLSFIRHRRGRTTDDAALNSTPGKLEVSTLHHAHSSDDLRALPQNTRAQDETVGEPNSSPRAPPPSAGSSRRRSTNLGGATPLTRQKQLELAVDTRVADAFFSIHANDEPEPIYISEAIARSTNFNFQFFDFAQHPPAITRASRLTVRVWTHRQSSYNWSLLLEETVDLGRLSYIGSLENHHFQHNALIFHLTDGIYATSAIPTRPPRRKHAPAAPTSSYNALMKLASLENSIRDAMTTQAAIMSQINELLANTPTDGSAQAWEEADLANRSVLQQQRALRAAERKRQELRESITARRNAIRDGRILQERADRDVANASEKLGGSRELVAQTHEQIRGQRRRICSDLADIFPIAPAVPAAPLSFQICGLPLRNTVYGTTGPGKEDEDALSAALGYVATLTNSLQYYLSVPIPYPITPLGSRTSIRDDISLLADPNSQTQTRQRDFPLCLPRGGSTAAQFRFDYAWFLLNKNIEVLCVSQGLKVVDIRHTLPNLKYLLYVCSAGTDEVPERKRGGVRGLWAARLEPLGTGRPASNVSAKSGNSNGLPIPVLGGIVRDEETDSSAMGSLGSVGLPFDEERVTLRTKGLRENLR